MRAIISGVSSTELENCSVENYTVGGVECGVSNNNTLAKQEKEEEWGHCFATGDKRDVEISFAQDAVAQGFARE